MRWPAASASRSAASAASPSTTVRRASAATRSRATACRCPRSTCRTSRPARSCGSGSTAASRRAAPATALSKATTRRHCWHLEGREGSRPFFRPDAIVHEGAAGPAFPTMRSFARESDDEASGVAREAWFLPACAVVCAEEHDPGAGSVQCRFHARPGAVDRRDADLRGGRCAAWRPCARAADLQDAPRGRAAARGFPRGRRTGGRRGEGTERGAAVRRRRRAWRRRPRVIEFEFWYLLALPLLFGAGWLARGFESRAHATDQAGLPRSYFRGLNLLLNDQHDKAIDAFIEVVKLDPETIELHHALGNLFRRRGEFDRAVRIHTHLLNRADLPASARSQALAELGQDYLKGGLLDRAEDAFTRLLEDTHHRFDALRALLRIYQMEREWLKAVDCARLLEREAGESHGVAISHFYCELAAGALEQGRFDEAQGAIDEALAAHRKSVRALILAGDLQMKRGNPG